MGSFKGFGAMFCAFAATATIASAQEAYAKSEWEFGRTANAELGTEISAGVGHGVQIHVAFLCNEGGRYSYIGSSDSNRSAATDEHREFVGSYMDGDLKIETYRSGARTLSFRPTGFHRDDDGLEVTDAQLRAMQEADFLVIVGAKRPIALPAHGARIAFAQYQAACAVYGAK